MEFVKYKDVLNINNIYVYNVKININILKIKGFVNLEIVKIGLMINV